MNIKRAKEEIKNTIQAYLLKDEYGDKHTYQLDFGSIYPVQK